MPSKLTYFSVVNTSGLDITNISVSGLDDYDWRDDTNRLDKNFQGAAIPRNESRCELEALNPNANGVSYAMTLTFSDGSNLSFAGDQQDAFTKQDRIYPATGSATSFLQVYQTSGGDSNAMNIQTIQVPDNSGWMGDLLKRNPKVAVNQITMPGSHDAGMYTISRTMGSQPEWAQTQNLDIEGQLHAGSRYFDLRLYFDGQQLRTGHFSADMGAFGPPLADVLTQVKTFITSPAAASEAVFLKFSHTSSGLNSLESTSGMTSDAITQIKDILGDVLYKTTNAATNLAELPLSTLAGKVCVVVDYEYGPHVDPAEGIFRYTDITADNVAGGAVPGLDVYDNYSDTGSVDYMRTDQENKLVEYGGYGKSYLFLMSWTLTGKPGFVMDVQVLAGMANCWLPMFTTNSRSAAIKPNVIYYDYVNPYLCRCIIETNA